MADASDDLSVPMKPVRPAAPGAGSLVKPPTMRPRAPGPARAAEPARAPEPLLRPGDSGVQSRHTDADIRKLIVGHEITFSGEIHSCDKLMIEGSVEANLDNCRALDIAEGGLFKGSGSIEEAEIRGCFEGNLVVRNRLLIKVSGRVSGTIRYGQLGIECGGQISGDVQAQSSPGYGEVMADAPSGIAVGTSITGRPPHRTVRAAFPHTAPTLGG
jgi:cytoskeletal protein CcmA (bactofilin family)